MATDQHGRDHHAHQDLIGHPAGVPFDVNLPFAGSTYSAGLPVRGPSRTTGTVITSNCLWRSRCTTTPPAAPCSVEAVSTSWANRPRPSAWHGIRRRSWLLGETTGFRLSPRRTTPPSRSTAPRWPPCKPDSPTAHAEHALGVHRGVGPRGHLAIDGFGCELGGAQLPSVKCTGSTSTVVRSTSETMRLNILVPNGGQRRFPLQWQRRCHQRHQFRRGAWQHRLDVRTGDHTRRPNPRRRSHRIENTSPHFTWASSTAAPLLAPDSATSRTTAR